MTSRWAVVLWLLVLTTGCSSVTRSVRLDTGEGAPIVHIPPAGMEPVEVKEGSFREAVSEMARRVRPSSRPQAAARQLFEVEARSGAYRYAARSRALVPEEGSAQASELPRADVELTRAYLRWCERTDRPGDCLRLLEESPTVSGDGRYALSMALAQGVVLEEMLEAFKDMADPQAVLTALLWTVTTYMILWTVPEPVSKGIAAVMSAVLIAYLGVDTFWGLIQGWRLLVDEADRATTFEQLREAGARYGKVMGRNAARAFVLIATVAIGNTAAGLGAKVPTLPGSARAAVQAEEAAGLWLPAAGEVQVVAVSGEAVTIALAPGATAMAASGSGGAVSPGSITSPRTRTRSPRCVADRGPRGSRSSSPRRG